MGAFLFDYKILAGKGFGQELKPVAVYASVFNNRLLKNQEKKCRFCQKI
jgi:hypothetical protein